MLFILQDHRESNALSVEIEELRFELDENAAYNYIVANSNFFKQNYGALWLKEAIPVGTIEFVQAYLSNIHNIHHMSPIEIPKELRLHKFLLRDYQIVKYTDIPKDKYKFVKNVSVLKKPTFAGNTSDIFKEDWLVNVNDFYQVSDVINILSEYRIVVMDNKILGVQFYDGIPTIIPNEREIRKIQEMVLRYSQSKACPSAYAMDVAVVRSDDKDLNHRDLALLEIQSFASCGTYGCRGRFLPQLYQRGLQWYLKYNTSIEL